MKSLFTSDPAQEWTDEARTFEDKISKVLRPIFKEAKDKGFSLIELGYIVNWNVLDQTVLLTLEERGKKSKPCGCEGYDKAGKAICTAHE